MHKSIVFWGLCAVLVFVPLPIGLVEGWAICVFEAATLALFLVYVGGELVARRRRAGSGAGGKNGLELPGRLRFSGPPETGFRAWGDEDWNGAGSGTNGGAVEAFPRAVKILLAVFFIASVIQILPLPPVAVKVLSPRAAAIYQGLGRDGLAGWDARSWWTLSLAPRVSAAGLVLFMCYGLFGFLVLRTARTRRRLETLVLVMIGSALFQAIYGMAETFSGSEMIFGLQKKYNIGSVTGTYVNRNHFAGFMEMAFPLTLGYLLARARFFQMEKGLGWRRRFLWFSQESLQWSLLVGLGSVFIGIALIFSKSRSGVMIFLVTVLLAAGALGSWRELSDRADERRRARGILRLVVAAMLAVALWLGIGPVIERFGEMDISKEARRTFAANTVRMTGDFLWAGAGKGTYVDVYPMYKKIDDGLLLSYAHNDYLQVTAENGLIAGGCLIVAGIWLFAVLAGRWRKRRANFGKGVGLGAILGILAILIHGFTDFNLQIPANAVYFVGLCALATNAVTRRKKGEEEGRGGAGTAGALPAREGAGEKERIEDREDGRKRGEATETANSGRRNMSPGWTDGARAWKTAVMGVAAVALLVAVTRDFFGFHYLRLYRDARSEARSVQSAFPRLERILKEATRASGRPEIIKEAARLDIEMARAENEAGKSEKRDGYCDRALANYAAVLAGDPIDSTAHYEMGMTYLLYNYPLMTYADKAKLYFRKALELNPADEFLNLNILYYYLTAWDGLDEAEKEYAGGRLKKIRAADPGFMPQLEQRWKEQFGSTEQLDRILRLTF